MIIQSILGVNVIFILAKPVMVLVTFLLRNIEMKLFQFDTKIWNNGEVDRTCQFGFFTEYFEGWGE